LSGSGSPVVVNFMGWMEGMGLKLLGDSCRLINPTDIVQLDAKGKRGANVEILNADSLFENTIYYKNRHGELVEPITTPEFLLVSRKNENNHTEQSKSKNLSIPAWQHREMMIDMQIETVLTKTVQIHLKNTCLAVLDNTIQEHLYPAAMNGQLVAIFSEKPRNGRKKCVLLPGSKSSSLGCLNPVEIDQSAGFNKFSAFDGLNSSETSKTSKTTESSETSESDDICQFETCKIYNPVESECIGMGFVNKIEGSFLEMIVSEKTDPEKIVYIVKGDAKGLALNPGQMRRLAKANDYVENFERENVVRGADYFIKTKRVFK